MSTIGQEDIYLKILRENWGYDDFRGIQREIIESIGAGHDTLGLMPTGGGKSVTFQVPALATEGVCLVITPLIALMKDQVANLRKRGIRAAAIYSGMKHSEVITTLENAIFGGVKILYVSPERLSSELFQKKLSHMQTSFITVDEAHCICQWGYDFRPSYLKIADIRKIKPDTPVLALTATATQKVIEDIQDKLGFKNRNVFNMSFERKNLAYVVKHATDKLEEIIHILKCVEGSAIVYVRNREKTKEISQLLNDNKIKATFYHAGLENSTRDLRQNEWTNDNIRVMVATNAFGMGIDKPDVRVVIHSDCPDSIEAYFQEAGRAGRDGQKAYAIMLYNNNDKSKLERRVDDTFPDKDYIRTVYEHIAYFYQIGLGSGEGHRFEFNIDKFCQIFKHFPTRVNSALKILSKAGYIEYEDADDGKAQVMMLLKRDDMYRLDSLTDKENSVITALLRNYGGLFSSFCHIDESLIAMNAEIGEQETYEILKSLDKRLILKFIPHKKIPHIRYTHKRIKMSSVVLPNDIYEQRKKEYIGRINAILNYATNNDICRSRMLLKYFGETKSTNCMQCDVCIAHNKKKTSKEDFNKACRLIIDLLNDNRPHHVTEIKGIDFDRDVVEEALEYLISEEKIFVRDGKLMA